MNDNMNVDAEKTVIGTMEAENKTQMVSQPQSNPTQMMANIDCPVCHTANPPSETYCTDCGFMLTSQPVALSDMPAPAAAGKLVLPDGTREFPLNPGPNTVGRENADVLLTHNTVSRKHGLITVADGKVLVEDTGSTNGTYVDGAKVAPGEKVELKDGGEVMFGSMALKYEAPAQESDGSGDKTPETTEASEPEESAGEPTVITPAAESVEESTDETAQEPSEVETPEETPAEEQGPAAVGNLVSKDGAYSFPIIDGTNTIGRRDGANMIVVPDPYASGRHADLLAENGAFTLTDIGSTNGTLVNGVKLDPNAPKQIQPGDEITIGRIVFTIEVE